VAIGTYVCGMCLGVASFKLSGAVFWVTLLSGWIMTVNGARRMISTVAHQCVHGAFSGNRRLDMTMAEVLSVLTLTQTAGDYRREHFELHHRHEVFSSVDDPSAKLLWDAGFRPGLSTHRLWRNLALTLVSVRFHAKFIYRRIASQIQGRIDRPRLCAMLLVSVFVAATLSVSSLHATLLGAVFPIAVLYQMSVLLEFISEHAWFVESHHLGRKKYIHGTHSWGRFCGKRAPSGRGGGRVRRAIDWTLWVAEHLVYHLPVRLVVLPGDLSQHDFHHRNPSTTKWTTAIYARDEDAREGDRRWPPYKEFWGLHHAISHVFQGITSSTAASSGSD
jgi:hypothetical protein